LKISIRRDASGATVNTNDTAKENVDRFDDATPEEQATTQLCRQILKRIDANQTGTINLRDSPYSAKELGDKEDMLCIQSRLVSSKNATMQLLLSFSSLDVTITWMLG
jgi:hypothetical protein